MSENGFLIGPRNFDCARFFTDICFENFGLFKDLYGKPFIDKRNWEAAVVLLHRRGGGGGWGAVGGVLPYISHKTPSK